jgi:hypothetical protein
VTNAMSEGLNSKMQKFNSMACGCPRRSRMMGAQVEPGWHRFQDGRPSMSLAV